MELRVRHKQYQQYHTSWTYRGLALDTSIHGYPDGSPWGRDLELPHAVPNSWFAATISGYSSRNILNPRSIPTGRIGSGGGVVASSWASNGFVSIYYTLLVGTGGRVVASS
ncbi:hypothetical protein HAX54_005576 [Datura stramonium]|uniref:Uncharacterized protein n=1 Tax=Datura stramonium TaxID=4076 RepID=A0ABS8T8Z6_DATST|nr:hypothetical protein [Datura stramonium]